MWLRLDDAFPSHPKVVGLSDRAFRAHVVAMCYCAHHLTDGFIPEGAVDRRAAKELVAAGLWDPADAGVWVHDFLDWNKSRADVEGSREQANERMTLVRANRHSTFDDDAQEVRSPRTRPSPKALQHPSSFEAFWDAYPRKVGKRTAASAFERASTRAAPDDIIRSAARLAADPNLPEERFIPHPTTWLNRDGWHDEPLPPRTGKTRSVANILRLAGDAE